MTPQESPRPGVPELLQRAREIAAHVRARAEQTEAERRISADVIDLIRDRELFRILQPQACGGFEYGFDVFARVVAAIGEGCGSSAWVYGLGASHHWLTACLPAEAQKEVWSDPEAIAMGSYAPVGTLTAVDGGYRLSGSWGFTSGCDNAQWFYLGGMLPSADGAGAPKPAFFLIPSSDARIEDTWHTMGLAGTGSKNVVTSDTLVPFRRVLSFSDLVNGTTPGSRIHVNPLYRQSLLAVLPVCLVAPLLGMAEAALTDFLNIASVRTTRGAVTGGKNRMAELATIQLRVAEATGCIDAARLMMFRDLEDAQQAAVNGQPNEPKLRLRNRLDHAFCTRLLVQAVDALFLASGGQGIFTGKPLQRYWRDAHAAAAHISLNWDTVGTMYGQYALGLEPKGQY